MNMQGMHCVAAADQTLRNDLSRKLGAGVGVPVGCILLAAGLAYIQYSRKKRRKRQQERHQHEQKVQDTYTQEAAFAENGPHELEAKAPSTTLYMKAELSEDSRRHIAELSAASQLHELPEEARRSLEELSAAEQVHELASSRQIFELPAF
ncbi:MAG: hypothetical protein LQ344_001824 [Seirophora lacunosa]|nr:MAG: hypothetical protein LQ344_001824 [Seirophora lacunosa]